MAAADGSNPHATLNKIHSFPTTALVLSTGITTGLFYIKHHKCLFYCYTESHNSFSQFELCISTRGLSNRVWTCSWLATEVSLNRKKGLTPKLSFISTSSKPSAQFSNSAQAKKAGREANRNKIPDFSSL